MSAPDVSRAVDGRWLPGVCPNPTGMNQHTDPRKRTQRRLETAAQELLRDPVCVETIVEKLIAGMKDPDGNPVSARIAYERLWPVVKQLELRADGEPAPGASSQQWAELAAGADREISGVARLVGPEPHPGTVEGAD